MIVRCENCGTEFGFDDRQVGEGITVRCSVCKHVFKVESQTASAQSWQIRTTEGTSFKAPDIATLREWIDEGRLHPDDQVSRTGRNWVRLGDMPEFARAFAGFQGVASVVSPVRPADPARTVPQAPAPSTVTTLPPVGAPTIPLVPPQSQRPTVSPPRSFPPQANAPVAPQRPVSSPAAAPARPVIPPSTRGPQSEDDDIDGLLVDDDDEETAAAIPARTPAERSSPQRARAPAPEPEPVKPVKSKVPEPAPEPAEAPDDDEFPDFEAGPGKRRGVSPGLIAFLGVIAAVGVMFGVPSIRTKLLSLGQDAGEEQPPKAQRGPEIQAAELALANMGTASLARAEADLQRAIDAGSADAATTAAMKVALADLLLSRAIAYEIAAALDAAQREDFRRRAADDQEDGERLIDGLEGAPDIDRLTELRALARLAAGRAEAEVLPLVPDGATETKLIVQAAVLWQDLGAPVPAGLVAGLTELNDRSGLGESALALALVRAGDSVAARNAAERLLVGAEDQIVALAVRSHLAESGAPTEDAGETEGETGADEPTDDTAGDPNVAKAPPRPGESDGGGETNNGGGGGGGGGGGFDKLVERGCSQVKSGEAAAGVKTLLRAFDMKDNNLDVLVCLAEGYAAQGQNTQAATFFDRALDQSPSNIPALRGAAKLAAKTGSDERAKKLYERLLAADPNNAAAQAYLAKHGGQEAPAEEPPQDPPPSG
jgi:predicted Zn finger-like uncharacterized protein